ncbi:MAG: alpha/beta hydrolase [Gammaproteobacteria bacterium]|nr:alpha/beta hydrolase [Gammaproteobacteria bacterium]
MIPLVMLPGMLCDHRLFASQVAVLSELCQVSVLPVSQHVTVSRIADSVLRAAPKQFALAGLSLGGIVAMEVLRQAPERVERLALIDTNPLADSPVTVKTRIQQIEKVKAGGFVEVVRGDLKPYYLAANNQHLSIPQLCLDMALDQGPDVFIRQSLALKNRRDQCDTLEQVAVPTLIMMGEQDRLCPLNRHQLMHSLVAGSEFVTIPDAGHLPSLEQPEITTSYLQAWLED